MTKKTSPGKSSIFQRIAAASTAHGLLATAFDEMCHLDLHAQPLMQFLFVRTRFCSPAYFRPRITPDALAAY
ncbi:MAG: hypothetical protein AB8F78_16460 [Saprospiraceae bacterium]